jgi:hypothetical protein
LPAFPATLFELCRFRRGPEDMPWSLALLVSLLAGCALLQAWFGLEAGVHARQLVATWAGGLAALGAVALLLRSRSHPERFVQTATALAAVYLAFGIVVNLLALALPREALRAALEHPTQAPTLTGLETLVLFVIMALSIWQLCVWVRVLRRALDVSLAGAILAFIGLFVVNLGATGLVAVAAGAA